MRPIEKPACPEVGGVKKTVTQYREWKRDLEVSIGCFCTYCGMRLNNSPQVEHVVPIHPAPGNPAGDALDWDNVVLSCGPCNGADGKRNKNYNSAQHYMPEIHNTLIPYRFVDSPHTGHVVVEPEAGLSPNQITKASETINLFNFQHIDQRPAKVDFRSSERWQACEVAKIALREYKKAKLSTTFNASEAAEYIAIQAVSTGFFLIWVKLFINEPDVLKALINNKFHPGTHQGSFDPVTGKPIPRNPNNAIDPI
jgi:hypothetical protein